MHTPQEQLRLLWHCLPSSFRCKGQEYFLELAVADVSMPGHTVATRQVPIHGGWLYPNQACTCFAWQSGPSTVVVTGMLDLLDVAIIELTGPVRCSPAVMSGGALTSSVADALQINWSASGNLMAITRNFCSILEVLQDEELLLGRTWTTSADFFFCNAFNGQLLHQAVVEEPMVIGSCFSHNDQHFAIWGRQEGAESALAQLLLLNTATWTWQHASLSAPVPLDCKKLVWGPDSSWLACTLLWHNDDSSSEDGFAGNTCHEWECAADRGGTPFLIKLDPNHDAFRVVINAATGKIVYMWQGDPGFLHQSIFVCPAGIFDPDNQHMVYIRPDGSYSPLDQLACKSSPCSHEMRLQAVKGPKLPVGCDAILSPGGEVLVDCGFLVHRYFQSIMGPQRIDIQHYCHQSGRSYRICLGQVTIAANAFSPVWLPCSPKRPIYAISLMQHTVHLIDAFHHCILRSWSTHVAMPMGLAEDVVVDLAMWDSTAELMWLPEAEGLAALYRLKSPPQLGAWCHVTSFM